MMLFDAGGEAIARRRRSPYFSRSPLCLLHPISASLCPSIFFDAELLRRLFRCLRSSRVFAPSWIYSSGFLRSFLTVSPNSHLSTMSVTENKLGACNQIFSPSLMRFTLWMGEALSSAVQFLGFGIRTAVKGPLVVYRSRLTTLWVLALICFHSPVSDLTFGVREISSCKSEASAESLSSDLAMLSDSTTESLDLQTQESIVLSGMRSGYALSRFEKKFYLRERDGFCAKARPYGLSTLRNCSDHADKTAIAQLSSLSSIRDKNISLPSKTTARPGPPCSISDASHLPLSDEFLGSTQHMMLPKDFVAYYPHPGELFSHGIEFVCGFKGNELDGLSLLWRCGEPPPRSFESWTVSVNPTVFESFNDSNFQVWQYATDNHGEPPFWRELLYHPSSIAERGTALSLIMRGDLHPVFKIGIPTSNVLKTNLTTLSAVSRGQCHLRYDSILISDFIYCFSSYVSLKNFVTGI